MNVYEVHSASLSALQTELDTQGAAVKCPIFTWAGKDYKALPGGAHLKKDLTMGGLSLDADLMITVLVAQFNATANAQRDAMLRTKLIYLGHNYRIESVTIAAGGQQLRIECRDAVQGA